MIQPKKRIILKSLQTLYDLLLFVRNSTCLEGKLSINVFLSQRVQLVFWRHTTDLQIWVSLRNRLKILPSTVFIRLIHIHIISVCSLTSMTPNSIASHVGSPLRCYLSCFGAWQLPSPFTFIYGLWQHGHFYLVFWGWNICNFDKMWRWVNGDRIRNSSLYCLHSLFYNVETTLSPFVQVCKKISFRLFIHIFVPDIF